MSQDEKQKATVSADDIAAIVGGYHGNPFSILGPHEADGNLVIRAFFPQASAVSVQIQDQSKSLSRFHWDGFFEIVLPGVSLGTSYQFRVESHSGSEMLYEDPYAFGSTLSDTDRYLLADGN